MGIVLIHEPYARRWAASFVGNQCMWSFAVPNREAILTNQQLPTFPIAGFANINQLLESIQAGDAELSSEVIHYLENGV